MKRLFLKTLIMILASEMGFGCNNPGVKLCKWMLKGSTVKVIFFFFFIRTKLHAFMSAFNNNKTVFPLLGSDPGKTNINPLYFSSGNIRICCFSQSALVEFLPFSAGLEPQSGQHRQKMRSHMIGGGHLLTTNWTTGKLHLFVKMKGISFTHKLLLQLKQRKGL